MEEEIFYSAKDTLHDEEKEEEVEAEVAPFEEEEEGKTEKGVCYFPKIPPYMNPNNLRKLLSQRFKIERIYLEAESKKSNSDPWYS